MNVKVNNYFDKAKFIKTNNIYNENNEKGCVVIDKNKKKVLNTH